MFMKRDIQFLFIVEEIDFSLFHKNRFTFFKGESLLSKNDPLPVFSTRSDPLPDIFTILDFICTCSKEEIYFISIFAIFHFFF